MDPGILYKRLGYLFEVAGDAEQSELYKRLAEEASNPGKDTIKGE